MFNLKQCFVEELVAEFGTTRNLKILDLGCGQAKNFLSVLERFPNLHYVGVEPGKRDAGIAADSLRHHKNAKIYNQLAYAIPEGEGDFDICLSLSVLEHVKQLELFLANSVKAVKSGGRIIHRYDLGHALTPSSVKESLQVFLGNNFPVLLPEHKFVSYVSQKRVCDCLIDSGAEIEKITYHQMPSHKKFLKYFTTETEEKLTLAKRLSAWESEVSKYLGDMDILTRESLFPAVTIWATKR